jgi:protein-histidine N-methyltransferase
VRLDLSPASAPYREVDPEDIKSDADTETSSSQPGEVELTSSLREAFMRDLASRGIQIRFFAGGWSTFAPLLSSPSSKHEITPFSLVLSSETVYERTTMPVLVRLLKQVLPYSEEENRARCLVAAKVLYFGVGGGIPDFVKETERMGGKVTKVWKQDVGVGREIMAVQW